MEREDCKIIFALSVFIRTLRDLLGQADQLLIMVKTRAARLDSGIDFHNILLFFLKVNFPSQ
jgi:hypothetical protein